MPSKAKFEPVDVLCGNTLPKPIMSSGARLMLEFRGRNSGKGNRGFKAEYVFLESKICECEMCANEIVRLWLGIILGCNWYDAYSKLILINNQNGLKTSI